MNIVLAGTGSAVGKTTIATGIMKVLSEDYNIQPYKVGPDYIDPSYHSLATGNYSRNLDSFFMDNSQINTVFQKGLEKSKSKIGIIEGVRGLYEGISPISDVGNTASIAKALNSPVILIIDSRSLVKSAAAIVLGFKALDPEINIAGVILNKVKGQRHYLKTKESIETLTNTPVIGGIPRDDNLLVKQRHLGLVPALEKERINNDIDNWANVIREYIDLDMLLDIIKSSKENEENIKKYTIENPWDIENHSKVKIGIAYDNVFSFYYQDTFDALEDNNASLSFFSPYADEEIPDVDALYIGGGYPEVFDKELSNNHSMLNSIKSFVDDGHPVYAECGGLIYLSDSINDNKMVGSLPYKSYMTDHVQGLSYVIAKSKCDSIISNEGDILRGHEFHYTQIYPDDNANFAFDIERGRGIKGNLDGLMKDNVLAAYMHIHPCSYRRFPSNFVRNISDL